MVEDENHVHFWDSIDSLSGQILGLEKPYSLILDFVCETMAGYYLYKCFRIIIEKTRRSKRNTRDVSTNTVSWRHLTGCGDLCHTDTHERRQIIFQYVHRDDLLAYEREVGCHRRHLSPFIPRGWPWPGDTQDLVTYVMATKYCWRDLGLRLDIRNIPEPGPNLPYEDDLPIEE